MNLSKLSLNSTNRQVQRDLGNRQELHRTIMCAMPEVPGDAKDARSRLGVLFRVDVAANEVVALVQSLDRPDWTVLPSGYLSEPAVCKSVDRQYEALLTGDVLRFRLLANATRRATGNRATDRGNESAWAGKRIEFVTEEDQLSWLMRQGVRCGFALVPSRVNPEIPDVLVRRTNKLYGYKRDRATMSFGSVLFEGYLRITNLEPFREGLTYGVGRGKAYGFGLLSVSR